MKTSSVNQAPPRVAPIIAMRAHAALRDDVAHLPMETPAATGGTVIAVLPCKGGAGATFIATNLAYAIAAEGKRVAMLDLNLYFGEAALYVSDTPAPATVADLAGEIDRLDAALLESSMLKISPNFWLLAAPDSPEKAVAIRAESIERILDVARASFDFVILDVSRALDATAIKALDCSDRIYLVMQAGLPFIRNGRRLLTLFRALSYPDSRIQLLVNRYQKDSDINLRELERALGASITKTLPNSYDAVDISINQGRPILEIARRDPVSRALREIARELARTPATADSWLQRFRLPGQLNSFA